MANAKITDLTSYSNPDAVNDSIPIVDSTNNQTKRVSRNNLLGITGAPIGDTDSQTLSNKTLTNPTINAATLSGTIAGTYTIGGTPTFPATVVTTTASQTLTNKVLTSPVINTATIANPTLAVDSISGYTAGTSGTIYGIPVTTSKISGTAISNSTVGASQLNTGAQAAVVATGESTTSLTYADLTTTTDTVTVTIGANGLALVTITSYCYANATDQQVFVSYAMSGANTFAANHAWALNSRQTTSNAADRFSVSKLWTGLTAGSTTFKMKYATTANTATFYNREISVIPL